MELDTVGFRRKMNYKIYVSLNHVFCDFFFESLKRELKRSHCVRLEETKRTNVSCHSLLIYPGQGINFFPEK
jgi:hypothetical protein